MTDTFGTLLKRYRECDRGERTLSLRELSAEAQKRFPAAPFHDHRTYSNWELDRSWPDPRKDRAELVAIISVLQSHCKITLEEADQLLAGGGYAALTIVEREMIFDESDIRRMERPKQPENPNPILDLVRRMLNSDKKNIRGRYWDTLLVDNQHLKLIDEQYDRIRQELEIAFETQDDRLQLEIVICLAHYWHDRLRFSDRLKYSKRAVESAIRLGRYWDEAILRIDAIAYLCIQLRNYAPASLSLEKARNLLHQIEPDNFGQYDLTVLEATFRALLVLRDIGKPIDAQHILSEVESLPCRAIIRSRWNIVQSEAYELSGNLDLAINHATASDEYEIKVRATVSSSLNRVLYLRAKRGRQEDTAFVTTNLDKVRQSITSQYHGGRNSPYRKLVHKYLLAQICEIQHDFSGALILANEAIDICEQEDIKEYHYYSDSVALRNRVRATPRHHNGI